MGELTGSRHSLKTSPDYTKLTIESILTSKNVQNFLSLMKMVQISLGATKVVDQRLLPIRSLMAEEETTKTITGVVIEDVAVEVAIRTTMVVMMASDTTIVVVIKAKLGRVVITTMMTTIKMIIVLEQVTTTSEERKIMKSDLI